MLLMRERSKATLSSDINMIKSKNSVYFKSVVPKVGVNYPPGVICNPLGGYAEPKPQCCSVL